MGAFKIQFDLFLDITKRLNQIPETPGVYGSLGLFNRFSINKEVKDIDFLIDNLFLSKKWSELVNVVTDFSFAQDPAHEHEFVCGENAVSFFGFDELFKLTGIKSTDIPLQMTEGARYKLPTEKQFLKIYQSGLRNKWRKQKKEKEDLEKIDLIGRRLIVEYHGVVDKIINLLKDGGYWFETFEHEPVRTSEEAAKVRTCYSLTQGAKAMIVRVKKSQSDKFFAMLVLPGDRRFDSDKVRRLFGAKDIRFATEEEVATVTGGVAPGGVPPFGNIFGLEVVIDPSLFENERIVFNAGDKRFSIGMKSADFREIVKPKVITITSL